MDAYRLGVDFGTSTTVAVLAWPDGAVKPLVFDGSELLPSAVCATGDGAMLVGRDAIHAARTHPEGFEPNPKRCVDDGAVLLGAVEVPVPEMFAAVLRRVAVEARRVAGGQLGPVTLTCPAGWGRQRRDVLSAAADIAGLGTPTLVAEPVAAASQFVESAGREFPVGSYAVVYDLGAGTFDAAVVRRTAAGFEVVAEAGLSDAGGLDIDEAVVAYLGSVFVTRDANRWARLHHPATPEDRRAARMLRDDVRAGKEVLSRTSSTFIRLPLFDFDAPLGREQLELLARPILDRTVRTTRAVINRAGIGIESVAGLFLVGGSTRMPLVATLLHQTLGLAPTVIDRPEMVVAEGSLRVPAEADTGTPADAGHGGPVRRWEVEDGVAAPVVLAASAPPVTTGGSAAHEQRPIQTDPPSASREAHDGGREATAGARETTAGGREAGAGGRRIDGGDPPAAPADVERRRRVRRRQLLLAATAVAAVAVAVPVVVNEARDRQDGAAAQRPSSAPTHTPSTSPAPSATPGAPRRIATLAGAGTTMAFSPDGRTIATSGPNYTVLLWDVADPAKPRRTATIAPKVAWVNAVEFSPDGRTLAIAGQGASPGLWDVSDRARPVRTASLTGFATGVYDLEFSPDGRTLATASLRLTALWNVTNRKRPTRTAALTDFTGAVSHVTFSRDGKLMATLDGAPALILWEFEDRDPIPFRMATVAATGTSQGLAMSANPRTLATADDDTTTLWDVLNRQRPAKGATLSGQLAHFSPDGDTVATVNRYGMVQLWNVTDPAHPARTHTIPGETARFAPAGMLAVSVRSGVELWML
ncbi:Hsp70 family protein [Actinomycetes bacterium KLBMP 9797]